MDECRDCGLKVANTSRHRNWHHKIASDFSRLQRQVRQLEQDLRSLRT